MKSFREWINEKINPYADLINEIKDRSDTADWQNYEQCYTKIFKNIINDDLGKIKDCKAEIKQVANEIKHLQYMVNDPEFNEMQEYNKKNDPQEYRNLDFIKRRISPKAIKSVEDVGKEAVKFATTLTKLKKHPSPFTYRDYQDLGSDELIVCYDKYGKEVYKGSLEDSPIDDFEEHYKKISKYELKSKNLIILSNQRLDLFAITIVDKNLKKDWDVLIIGQL